MAEVKQGHAAALTGTSELKVRKATASILLIPKPDTNKHLLLPAGEQPMPQGSSRIKRSPERLIGQGGLSKVCTMTHADSPPVS